MISHYTTKRSIGDLYFYLHGPSVPGYDFVGFGSCSEDGASLDRFDYAGLTMDQCKAKCEEVPNECRRFAMLDHGVPEPGYPLGCKLFMKYRCSGECPETGLTDTFISGSGRSVTSAVPGTENYFCYKRQVTEVVEPFIDGYDLIGSGSCSKDGAALDRCDYAGLTPDQCKAECEEFPTECLGFATLNDGIQDCELYIACGCTDECPETGLTDTFIYGTGRSITTAVPRTENYSCYKRQAA